MKFIKRQFIRTIINIKEIWFFMVIDGIEDLNLTRFGEVFFKTLMFGLFICYAPIVILFMPLLLMMFKDDEPINF